MNELKDLRAFVRIFTSSTPKPQLPMRAWTRTLGMLRRQTFAFSCPCGRCHEYVLSDGHLRLKLPQDLPWTSVVIYAEDDTIYVDCPHIGGLVNVSMGGLSSAKKMKVNFFIKYDTINNADNGWGLILNVGGLSYDFNIIGQKRKKYPTRKIASQQSFECEILKESPEKISDPYFYISELHSSSFHCACGAEHGMSGVRGDFSMVQWGGAVMTVPLLMFSRDSARTEIEKILYRCESHYSMVDMRPSHPVTWSAQIPVSTQPSKPEIKLPDIVLNVLRSYLNQVNLGKLK